MTIPIHLLIIEDSEDACLLILDEMRRHGYQLEWRRVETAESFTSALQEGGWDVVISDYVLPEYSAVAALAQVQNNSLDLPFIVISGSASEETVVAVMKAGAHDYVMKGNLTRLAPAIERELREAESRRARRQAEEAFAAERKQIQEALQRSEARLLLAQKVGHVGSWEVDLVQNTLIWSPETFRIFGFEPDEFTPSHQRLIEAVHPEDRARLLAAREKALRREGPFSIDHRIMRPDGTERFLHEQAELVFDNAGKATRIVGTVHDITEHSLLEGQLRQSQKMEAIGQLAGGIAHDFNNILTVILGYADLIASNAAIDQEVRDQLQQIILSSDRAAKLTRQLLSFSRKQPLQLRTLDLNELLNSLASALQPLIGETVRLTMNLESPLPIICADAGLLEQVLINLALNARDAMPRGGELRLKTSQITIQRDYCLDSPEARPGHFVRIEVSDTGSGINPNNLDRIFEPFFTTKEIGKGSGLGLSTVYGIIQQHQGWIEVQSQIGHGTSFSLFLPVSESFMAPKALWPKAPSAGSGELILLVEDEPVLRQLTRTFLERAGYNVWEAASGPEALRIWREAGAKFDLLLTDMVMPNGMSGRDLAIQLLTAKPDLKVLYSSGYSLELTDADFVIAEGRNFIAKPYNGSHLLKTVRACLDALD